MGLYFVVLLVLMAALVVRAPWFGLIAFSGYLHAVHVLHGRWRVAGIVATAVITATSQDGGLPKGGMGALIGYAVIIAFNLILAGVMMWFGWISEEQSTRRKIANAE